jgi:hypothetical protein
MCFSPRCPHKDTIQREVNWWDLGSCLQAMNETSLILHFNVSFLQDDVRKMLAGYQKSLSIIDLSSYPI